MKPIKDIYSVWMPETSVIKVALFDDNGTEVSMVSRNTTLISPQPGWAEVSMTETWEMTVDAIRELLASTHINSSQIAGIGVTGNMIGAWLIDKQGQPVRNAILACDTRTRPLFEQLIRQQPDILHQIYLFSGCAMEFGCTLPIVRWLAEHEPEQLARAQAVVCCKDWLCYQLTGSIHLDYTEAPGCPEIPIIVLTVNPCLSCWGLSSGGICFLKLWLQSRWSDRLLLKQQKQPVCAQALLLWPVPAMCLLVQLGPGRLSRDGMYCVRHHLS